jgi:quercetin dioxygenase-like cupin family protein
MSEPSAPHRFITATEVVHEAFPWCTVELMATHPLTAARDLFLCRASFPAGEAHRFHHHPVREEIIYVLEGEAEQWVGDQCRRLGPGEMAFIPAGVPHATLNPGPQELKFLAILSPGESAPGDFTVDVYTESPWRDLWRQRYPERSDVPDHQTDA